MEDISRLRRQVGVLQIIVVLLGIAICVLAAAAFIAYFGGSRSAGVLHVKGLVVEDASGHQRILIGAPVPAVSGRKRQDATVGMIVLGENGADRVAIGAPYPEPQIRGTVNQRIGDGAGLVFDDANGDERGGFGVMDNDGRATFGLDYPHGTGEAITIGVLPGETALSIHDSKTIIRASLLERNDAVPLLYAADSKGSSNIDMSIVRLNPYRVRHVVTEASDEALNKALDEVGR